MGEGWIVSVLREPVTPGYIALLVFIGLCMRWGPGMLAAFNERHRDRAKITGEDWQRFRDEIQRLAGECAQLRDKVNECEDDRLVWMGRAVKAEAFNAGQSQIHEAAAVAAAMERADPAKAPEAMKAAERARKIRDGEDGDGI